MTKRLTEAAIERLKPSKERRMELPDGMVTGLYLLVQPSGKRSWAVRYRLHGRKRKVTIGAYPRFGLSDARREAKAILDRSDRGEDVAETVAQDKKRRARGEEIDMTRFDNVARLFIARHAKAKGQRSWKTTASRLGLLPDPAKADALDDPFAFRVRKGSPVHKWGHKPIESIARRDVIAYLEDLVADGTGAGANRVRAALSKLFNWSIGRDLIEVSPCDRVPPPAREIARDRVLSDAELSAVWRASMTLSGNDEGLPFGPVIRMLILTAQRREEVAAMRWNEVNLESAEWVIPADRAKNGKANSVHLAPAALALLRAQPRIPGCEFVFSTTGRSPISGLGKAKDRLHDAASAILRREAEERGEPTEGVTIADWRLHDLRRTAASGMARLGVRLEVIEKILNHVSGSFGGIVGVYQRHDFAQERAAALDAWAREVSAIAMKLPAAPNVVSLRGTAA